MDARAVVVAVGVDGVYTGEGIDWTATFMLDGRDASAIVLAVPLPADTELTGQIPQAATARRDGDGRIVGFDVPHSTPFVRVGLHQPARLGDAVLAVPIVADGPVERVTLDGAEYRPDPGLGIDMHLGFASQGGIKHEDRKSTDDALGGHPHRFEGIATYFRDDARLDDSGGMVGTLAAAGALDPFVAVGVGVAFVAVLAILALSLKVLDRFAKAEAVDSYIKKEFVGNERK